MIEYLNTQEIEGRHVAAMAEMEDYLPRDVAAIVWSLGRPDGPDRLADALDREYAIETNVEIEGHGSDYFTYWITSPKEPGQTYTIDFHGECEWRGRYDQVVYPRGTIEPTLEQLWDFVCGEDLEDLDAEFYPGDSLGDEEEDIKQLRIKLCEAMEGGHTRAP
jgi:hypothetical protein